MSPKARIVVILLVVASVGTYIGCSKLSWRPVTPSTTMVTSVATVASLPLKNSPGRAFDGDKVDLCLVLSGQMYGYLQPCGCSRPQVGGLERRFELIKRLQQHGYQVSAADLGDLAAKDELGQQSRWKYETAANALKKMSYAALGLGSAELSMPVETALDLALNYKPPAVLAANLTPREPELYADVLAPWTLDDPRGGEDVANLLAKLQTNACSPLAGPAGYLVQAHVLPVSNRPRVGYFGLIGQSVAEECKKKKLEVKITSPEEALAKHLPAFLAVGAEVRVLLFQGTSDEAKAIAAKNPKTFQVILCRNDASDGVPPLLPIKLDGGTWLVMVGHKGRTVGVVAYRRGKPMDYRLEELIEELELPDDKTNPVRDVMKDYVWGVYNNKYLTAVPTISHPTQLRPEMRDAVFVGGAKCGECHKQAHAKWSGSQHSHAWESLVKSGRPIVEIPQKDGPPKRIGREWDPDCAKCHVTGFGYKGGFESPDKNQHLFGNGCENCHGPGSLHVAQPNNPAFREPLRLSLREPSTEQKCRSCHDLDNDPHFDIKKWEKIQHGRDR